MAGQWFIERLWRSVKYECVYLKAYDGPSGRASTLATIWTGSTPTGRIRGSMAPRPNRPIWTWGQSWRRPHSMKSVVRPEFPDHQGKYRGFSRFRPPCGRFETKLALSSLGFGRNSLPNRTGNCSGGAGIFFRRNREFSGRSREIHLAGRAGAKSCAFRSGRSFEEAQP